MSKLNPELFIARRLGGRGGDDPAAGSAPRGRGVMVRIAVATVAAAMAVTILAVAVIAGFRAEISDKIAAFAGHMKVQSTDYSLSGEARPIAVSGSLEREVGAVPGVVSMQPYALKMGIVKGDDATQGVMLKGVGAGYDLSRFGRWLTEGTLPRLDDSVRHKDILLSTGVARMLRLGVDDRVEMLFVDGDRPRRDRFRVSGLYSSGFGEMDDRFALTDIDNVRRLTGMARGEASGYEITLDGMERIESDADKIRAIVSAENAGNADGAGAMAATSVVEEFPQHFDWLATHDVNAAVIISIMVVVALISMISALLVILFERIRMIGILKTLGMNDRSLRRIFVAQAARVTLVGMAAGNSVGIGLALAQRQWGMLKLNSSGYFISHVPIELGVWWIVALNVGLFAVIVAFMVFPTSIVSRIDPAKTVRYQ